MSSKYTDFFENNEKDAKIQENNAKNHVSFDDPYSLPKHVKSREKVEKGFKEYLTHKEEVRSRGYVHPPFEVSRVPSPIHGYHTPENRPKPYIDYDRLKEEMKKPDTDLILFEKFVTEELEERWRSKAQQSNRKDRENKKHTQKNRPKKISGRAYGLNRTLESIMEEEKGGNNSERRNVPGLFDYRKDS